MEATATWAEDELYDDVNDNRQYLADGPLGQPDQSLDQFGAACASTATGSSSATSPSGSRDAEGGLPTMVREMWERADGSRGAAATTTRSRPSPGARRRATPPRGCSRQFADANRRPRRRTPRAAAYPPRPGGQGRR